MFHLDRVPVFSNLHVVLRVHGTFHVFFKRGQAPYAFVVMWILGRNFPHSNLPVLVTGENFAVGDYYGFDQPTA